MQGARFRKTWGQDPNGRNGIPNVINTDPNIRIEFMAHSDQSARTAATGRVLNSILRFIRPLPFRDAIRTGEFLHLAPLGASVTLTRKWLHEILYPTTAYTAARELPDKDGGHQKESRKNKVGC